MSSNAGFGRRGRNQAVQASADEGRRRSSRTIFAAAGLGVIVLGYAAYSVGSSFLAYRQAAAAAAEKEQAERKAALELLQAKENLKEFAKGHAASLLKNPDSAKFRDVRVVDTRTGPMVCGYINGTNAFGGYAGESQFVHTGRWTYLLQRGEDNPPAGIIAWNEHCR